MKKAKKTLKVIGWREWVTLPDLGVKQIKAKIDTGARTSSIHGFDVQYYKRGGSEYIKFKVSPLQKTRKGEINCHAKVLEYRKVKSSNGQSELRPVILTALELFGERWLAEVTIANRDEMGFRMLIGREALKKRFLINPGRSFLGNKEEKKRK